MPHRQPETARAQYDMEGVATGQAEPFREPRKTLRLILGKDKFEQVEIMADKFHEKQSR